MTKRIRRRIIRSLDDIPKSFSSEDEEREWWARHDLSEDLYERLQASTRGLTRALARKLKRRAV
jgi:hypothetical protein